MRKTFKYALLAASALAGAASAQAGYVNGDLIVGFTGGASDFLYDLGPRSALYQGKTWNVGANLGTQFGVVGSTKYGTHVYATSYDSRNENGYDPTGNTGNAWADMGTFASTLTVGSSRTTTPTDQTGWTYNTAQPSGTPGSTFQNDFFNPNVASSSAAYLYDNLGDGTVTGGGGSLFTYDATAGSLTYIPEPTACSLFAGFGLLSLAVRRQLAKA